MRYWIIMLIFVGLLQASDEVKKVVFDFQTGDPKRFELVVFKGVEAHTTHYGNTLKEFDAVFVIHGGAYKFFLEDLSGTPYEKELAHYHKAYASRLKALVENYNVTFEVCAAGMRSRNLDLSRLYDFVRPVFSSTTGLIDWQEKGYPYVLVR